MWIDQFKIDHKSLAEKLLDNVCFLSRGHILNCFRDLLGSLDGWDAVNAQRRGQWFFVPFSGSAGESGDSMVHTFRMANNMGRKQFNPLFIYRSELVSKKLTSDDTVVLIDDFSGTGKQACDSWRDVFAELLAGGPRVVLLLIAATNQAIGRIAAETEMEPVCGSILETRTDVFSESCRQFTDDEKATLLHYCRIADKKNPRGWGDCGLTFVLAHRCPNNTIPILHACNQRWDGLFPRHE